MKKSKRSPRKKNAFPLIIAGIGLILFAVMGLLLGTKSQEASASSSGGMDSVVPMAVDYLAPELILTDLSGAPVSLADYQGQVVLVNNWATWCPPCRAEMPELDAYYQAHKAEAFTLISVSAGDTAAQVESFVQQYGGSFPMWLDLEGEALRAFQNNSLPSSYVIDRTGTVRLAWTGAISLEMLEAYVTPLLKE